MIPLSELVTGLVAPLAGDDVASLPVHIVEIGLAVPLDYRYESRSQLVAGLPFTRLNVGISRPFGRLRLSASLIRA